MGIKKKIILGFISIGTLLFISGLISSAELIRFNRSTYEIMQVNQNSIELTKKMLDAAQEQNTALLMSITDTTGVYNNMLRTTRDDFNTLFAQAELQLKNTPELTKIKQANDYYNSIVNQRGDSVTMNWFSQIYKTPYFNLTHSIKEYMVYTQKQIIEYTAVLESNAYRASMVGIIALGGGLMLMLLFFYLINKFFISPVLRIHKGLKKTLTLNLPYDVAIDTKDELRSLSEGIAQLIDKNKNA